MAHITRVLALVLVILFACTAGLAACVPANEAVIVSTPEPTAAATPPATPSPTPAATPTPLLTPTPLPVPPESLTFKQKSDMIGSRVGLNILTNPSRIYIFYLESKDQERLVWVKKESNPPGNGFDLLDVFNDEILFHVSIEPKDQANVTPSEFPKYVDRKNEMLSQYSIVAAGKMLDINDLYANNKIDFTGAGKPFDALSTYLKKTQISFDDWSRDEMLSAFIDATPAQYILPIWEYIPNAVTPSSYFNPPAPTHTPAPELTLEQKELLLGINDKFQNYDVGNVITFIVKFLNRNYRFWTVYSFNEDKTNNETNCYVYDFYSIFNMEYLFSVSVPQKDESGQPVSLAMYKKFLSETAPSLKGMSLYLSFTLSSVAAYYEDWEIEYNNNPTLKEWADMQLYGTEADYDKVKDTPLSKEKSIELFLDSTPQEEILPFWVFTPGAQIPEELKGIYSEADYPPAPAE